jgi:uncharacterized coiled-coil DUF342 family protein
MNPQIKEIKNKLNDEFNKAVEIFKEIQKLHDKNTPVLKHELEEMDRRTKKTINV